MTSPADHDGLSDSEWSQLDEAGRDEYLRARDKIALERHRHVIEGQSGIRHKVASQGMVIKLQAKALDRIEGRVGELEALLTANTAATARTEGKVDALVASSSTVLGFLNDAAGGLRLLGSVADVAKKFAWVAIPVTAVAAGWQVFVAWLKTGGPK